MSDAVEYLRSRELSGAKNAYVAIPLCPVRLRRQAGLLVREEPEMKIASMFLFGLAALGALSGALALGLLKLFDAVGPDPVLIVAFVAFVTLFVLFTLTVEAPRNSR
jgi:hypothetical protein